MSKRTPTKQEKEYRNFVASYGCLVCGAQATLHHVTGYSDRMGRIPRSEQRLAPLCPMHHQTVHDPIANDPVSVEGLNHRGFFKRHGVDLKLQADRLWETFLREQAA